MRPDDVIADFYDDHPYPPPIGDLDRSLAGWNDAARRVEHFRHWPTVPYRDDYTILIAGCGTSQSARWAARYPEAKVVGIDVSPSSLTATERVARDQGIHNLDLRELPIEEVGSLETSFDQIVCTGVLHHLADPVVGLRALHEVLAPEGALQLMVYARYGRFGISMIRDYAKRLDLGAVDLDDLARVLKDLPLGHPMSHVLRETPDFRDRDALADALLNPREQTYSVPQVFDLLDNAGMRFGRWVRQAPYRPQCGIMRDLSHGERIAQMGETDQFTMMELFRGTIARHSLIAHRNDSPVPPFVWSDQGWRDYIPIVPATVVVVEERLPTGIAAAVINRAHVDRDLVCFLTIDELAVFDCIDGKTRIGAVAGASSELFERLWLHDLVVIDATGVPG